MDKRKDNKGRNLKQGEIQKKDGRYEYRYTDLFGTRHSVYSWRLTDADPTPAGKKFGESLRSLEKKISTALDKGVLYSDANSITLNDLLEAELKECVGLAEGTVRGYELAYNKFIKSTIGKAKMVTLNYQTLYAFYTDIASKHGYSPASICKALLTKAYTKAKKMHIVDHNIALDAFDDIKKYKAVKKTKHNTPEEDRLTKPQFEAFVEFLGEPSPKVQRDIHLLLKFFIATGCRASEVFGISWSCILFDEKVIKIRQQLNNYRKAIKGTKTKAGNRSIYLMDDLSKLLKYEKERQDRENIHISVEGLADGDYLVFPYKDVREWNQSNFAYRLSLVERSYAQWAKANNKPTIPHLHPHIFRHTYCYSLCEAGIDIKVLQEQAGHASITMTFDRYVHRISENRIVDESSKVVEGNIRIMPKVSQP